MKRSPSSIGRWRRSWSCSTRRPGPAQRGRGHRRPRHAGRAGARPPALSRGHRRTISCSEVRSGRKEGGAVLLGRRQQPALHRHRAPATLGFSLKDVAAFLETQEYFAAAFTEDEVRAAQRSCHRSASERPACRRPRDDPGRRLRTIAAATLAWALAECWRVLGWQMTLARSCGAPARRRCPSMPSAPSRSSIAAVTRSALAGNGATDRCADRLRLRIGLVCQLRVPGDLARGCGLVVAGPRREAARPESESGPSSGSSCSCLSTAPSSSPTAGCARSASSAVDRRSSSLRSPGCDLDLCSRDPVLE